jgi:hypothetical protein
MLRISTPLALYGCLCLFNLGCSASAGNTGMAGTGDSGTSAASGSVDDGGAGGVFGAAGDVTATDGGAAGSTDTVETVSCTFSQMSSISAKIPTVGIVTWSTSLPSVQAARIDFGLSTSYGMTAPVDLTVQGYRTLMLGMKASHKYHFRVTASGGGSQCVSPDYTLMTGALANGLPKITVATKNAAAVSGGFLITGQYVINAGTTGAPAYILDADADIVWWYSTGSDATGARMSYDGTHMWINAANIPSGTAHVHRVTMDGLTDDDFSSQFTGQNHQLTVLPDETVAFFAYGTNGCDDIKERSPTGTVKTIVNSETAHGGTGTCHVNTVQYSKLDDTLVFSDLDHNCLTKVTRTGTTVWVLGEGVGGVVDSFAGDSWKGGEHGIHILGLDDFVIFNNNSAMAAEGSVSLSGTGKGSIAIEMKLDLTAMIATKSWSYTASPGIQNDVLGDVERLSNGNTVVGYSTEGVLDEVDANANLVQELTWPLGSSFGYIEKRATLYGPPPK